MSVKEEKQALRRRVLEKMKSFSENISSKDIYEILEVESEWKNAKNILLYAPLAGEIDLLPLLQRTEKNFYFPRVRKESVDIYRVTNKEDLETASFGILEPKIFLPKENPQVLDLIIVPGLAFDISGNRLGRGMGYYDRFLSSLSHVKTLALAQNFQMQEKVPMEAHDQKVGKVLCIPSTAL